MLACAACGRENAFGTRVCSACGKTLAAAGFPLGVPYAEGFGHVCPRCEAFSPIDAERCVRCELPLWAEEAEGAPKIEAVAEPVRAPAPAASEMPAVSFSAAPTSIEGSVPPAAAPVTQPPGPALAAAIALPERASGTQPEMPTPSPEALAAVASAAGVAPPSVPGTASASMAETAPLDGSTRAQARRAPAPSEPKPPAAPVFVAPNLTPPLPRAPVVTPPPRPASAAGSVARPLKGAVLEVPPAPGTALKDGMPVSRESGIDSEVSARMARATGAHPAARPSQPAPVPPSARGPSQPVAPPPPRPSAPVEPPFVAPIVVPVLAPSAPRAPAPQAAPEPQGIRSTAPDSARFCLQCGASVPPSFAFCGRCGAKMSGPSPVAVAGPAATAGAKLVLIKGEGIDGVAYPLSGTEQVAGRGQGTVLFPDDRFLSLRHASFRMQEGKLFLRDEGSLNGVYVRIRGPVELRDGDTFLCGEELLRFELLQMPRPIELVGEDGTVFYGTPLRDGIGCRLVQVLLGGRMGMVYVPTKASLTIGRESCDISFPRDRFISGRHTKLDAQGRAYVLQDLGSKNGTYLRIREERELQSGDFVFLGQQLFRVEVGA